MILKYDEALKRAENPDWFVTFYKREDVSNDETVDQINELVIKLGGNKVLEDYFEIKDDMLLNVMFEDDLFDYLYDLEDALAEKNQ